MGEIHSAVVEEATVEMPGRRAAGRVEQHSRPPIEPGHRRTRDRIEVVGVGRGGLGGMGRGQPLRGGPAVGRLQCGSGLRGAGLSRQARLPGTAGKSTGEHGDSQKLTANSGSCSAQSPQNPRPAGGPRWWFSLNAVGRIHHFLAGFLLEAQ